MYRSRFIELEVSIEVHRELDVLMEMYLKCDLIGVFFKFAVHLDTQFIHDK